MTNSGAPAGAAFFMSDARLAPDGPAALNRRRGRLAQLVRASRLHREGRRFESVTAYQKNRQPDFSGLPLRQPYAAINAEVRLARAKVRLAPRSVRHLPLAARCTQ